MILVCGLDYWTIKQKALNGSRGKLSDEQLMFVGFQPVDHGQLVGKPQPTNHGSLVGWLQPINPKSIDERLEELDALRDRAPGYFALLKRILENEKSK